MSFFSVLLLGLAVSLDGFGAGFAYGVRKLSLPLPSLVIICFSSSFSIFLSMEAGALVARLLSLRAASAIGGLLLLLVGAVILIQSFRQNRENGETLGADGHGLGVLSSVLREPQLADFDSSGVITGKEAVVLGVALALDAFAAGFGAAMMGFPPLATAFVVGIAKFVLLPAGVLSGRKFANILKEERASLVSGAVLAFLGLMHLL